MAVDGAGGEDAAVASDDLGARADDQRGVDPGHRVGVTGLTDAHDAAVADAHIGLHHTPVVEDERPGDDHIGCALGAGAARLPHRFADHLAATEYGFVAADAQVAFHLDLQVGVGQAHPVARGGPEQLPVARA